MKKILFLIPAALMIIALFAINASAMSPMREVTYVANLDKVLAVEAYSSFAALEKIGRAEVRLDFDMYDRSKNKITVTAFAPVYRCGGNPPQRCMGIPRPPVVVVVPYTSRQVDECGSILYTGKEDKRPVDGIYSEIQVVDNRKNRCPHFVALAATEVTVIQKGNARNVMPVLWQGTASFTGSALEIAPSYH
jgi:hypothetical protein